MRAVVLGLCGLAGVVAGFGCSVFCADCKCPDGTYEVHGTVTEADRPELVGGTVNVSYGTVRLEWSQDAEDWTVTWGASAG